MADITLEKLKDSDREQFIRDNQEAFIYGATEEFGLPVYGEYSYPGTHLYVTPSASGWAPLLRTEAHSGWELITLHP